MALYRRTLSRILMICRSSSLVHSPTRKLLVLASTSVLIASIPASAAPKLPAPVGNPSSPTATSGAYILGPNDVIDISVTNHAELNSTIKIRPDGRFSMTRAGEVVAKGKTAAQLGQELEKRLARTLNHAHVIVSVKEASPRMVSITGAVKTAGTYPIKDSWRVLDLVGSAGGLSTKPGRITGRIFRQGQLNAINFDVAKAIAEPNSAQNVILRPDDRIQLDTQEYPPIVVAGSVRETGKYEYDENLTVSGLLAQAGNPSPDAALSKAYVLRNGTNIPLDLTPAGLLQPAMAQFKFEPGDVLTIPQNQMQVGVNGQVAKPNFYPLSETANDTTLLKVLAQAGGALSDADLERVTITRTNKASGESQVIPVNAADMVQGNAPDTFQLQPNDLVYIPKRDAQVSVVGPVQRPGSYPLTPGMTLISLIVAAGNPTSSAGLSRSYVLRDGAQIPINLRGALIEGKTDDMVAGFRLKNRDLLVIPDTTDLVSVTGQVTRPGSYNLDDNLTVASLLARAGNTTQGASLSRAYVQRGDQQIPLDLRSILGSGTPNPEVLSFRFQANDQLVIPENQLRFSVIGAVTRPGAYPYPEGKSDATLLKALGMAGGPTIGQGAGTANLKSAAIIRAQEGKTVAIPVDLSLLFSTAKSDKQTEQLNAINGFVLQPGDTLYIPAKGKKFGIGDLFGPVATLGALGLGF